MKPNYSRGVLAVLILITLAASSAFGFKTTNSKRKIEFSTDSKEAKDYVAQIVNRIETFQFGPDLNALAKKSVDADPNFAFGYYLLAHGMWQGEKIKIEQNGFRHEPNFVQLFAQRTGASDVCVWFGGSAIVKIDGQYNLE